jgi:putative effector of murein hydrolase
MMRVCVVLLCVVSASVGGSTQHTLGTQRHLGKTLSKRRQAHAIGQGQCLERT